MFEVAILVGEDSFQCLPWEYGGGRHDISLKEELYLPGVLAAHRIIASSPDMDLDTVSALRVGAW